MGLNINTLHIFLSTQIILFNIESAGEAHSPSNFAHDFRVCKKMLLLLSVLRNPKCSAKSMVKACPAEIDS